MSPLVAFASALAERIKINELACERRDGRVVWIKRRRWSAPPVLIAANLFFRLAGANVRAITKTPAWQRWEVDCFLELHGDRFQARPEGACAVAAEAMPGFPLARELDAGLLTPMQAEAAGRELRRAHEARCAGSAGEWSHGDPHTGNFVYDPEEDRARLIDFEVRHVRSLPTEDRQADDLLIFLQDLLGRIAASEWLPVACAFLDGYQREQIIARLPALLALPRGIAQLWWAIRTSYLPASEITLRLDLLNTAITARSAITKPLVPTPLGVSSISLRPPLSHAPALDQSFTCHG